jgi:hypothetical protein
LTKKTLTGYFDKTKVKRHAVLMVLLLMISACGNKANLISSTSTTTTTTVVTSGNTSSDVNTEPVFSSEQNWTSDSTWDMCLIKAPEGRKYEWLNYTTWMSLERQRREFPRSLIPEITGSTTAFVSSEENNSDYKTSIKNFSDAGCDLIVTIGAEISKETEISALQYPDVNFIGIDQQYEKYSPNLTSLLFPEDHAGFLAGALAASATVTKIVAVILDSETEPSSVAYGDGFTNGVTHVDPNIDVVSISHPGNGGKPDVDWGITAALNALDKGADVIFAPGSGSGSGVLKEVAGTGFDARNDALCIGAEVDDFFSLLQARRCLLTNVIKLPNEFQDLYWKPDRPAIIKQFENALRLPSEYESENTHSTLSLINREFFLGGNPSGIHIGPVGLGRFNSWGAHKIGEANRNFLPSEDLKSMLSELTRSLWIGEIPTS